MKIDNAFAEYSARISANQTAAHRVQEKQTGASSESFAQMLENRIGTGKSVSFSKHAQVRMEQREMSMSQEEIGKLNSAVQKAREKGVSDTLVLMGGKAFIVNTKSSVVVTAMNGDDLKDNVFTNIDGAVIA